MQRLLGFMLFNMMSRAMNEECVHDVWCPCRARPPFDDPGVRELQAVVLLPSIRRISTETMAVTGTTSRSVGAESKSKHTKTCLQKPSCPSAGHCGSLDFRFDSEDSRVRVMAGHTSSAAAAPNSWKLISEARGSMSAKRPSICTGLSLQMGHKLWVKEARGEL